MLLALVAVGAVLAVLVWVMVGTPPPDPDAAPDGGTTSPAPAPSPPQDGVTVDEPSPGADGLPPLTWAPPDTDGFQELVVDGPGSYRMDDRTDYVVRAPETVEGPVVLRGGRDVVWVGGHVRIPETDGFLAPTERRALVVQDGRDPQEGRVVHLEGLLIDGEDLAEGINTNAPSAVVQLQNLRIEGVHFKSRDDLDGRGDYDSVNHPDLVQTWGSVGELRIDGLTGTSAYQGLFLKADRNRPHGPVWLRRVDLTAVEQQGTDGEEFVGHRLLFWDPAGTGQLFIDTGTVWIDHDERSRWGTDFGNNVHPPTSAADDIAATSGSDERGAFVYWDADVELDDGERAVQAFDGRGRGLVYSGTPPQGSFVPEGTTGLDYRSPGYRTDPPTEDS